MHCSAFSSNSEKIMLQRVMEIKEFAISWNTEKRNAIQWPTLQNTLQGQFTGRQFSGFTCNMLAGLNVISMNPIFFCTGTKQR